MGSAWILTLAVFAPVLTGLLGLLLPKSQVTLRTLLALSGPLLAFVLIAGVVTGQGGVTTPPSPFAGTSTEAAHDSEATATVVTEAAQGVVELEAPAELGTSFIPWVPSLKLNFAYLLDGLGTFFALLVAGVGCMIVLYARGYFGGHTEQARADLRRFYPTLGFFATAMLGLVLSDYTLMTLVFWEMTSISSFLLIGWNRYDKHAVKLAMQAFFTTGLGGMFLFGGLALLGTSTDIWRWSDLLTNPPSLDDGYVTLALGLMFIGACSKSAQWPLHFWLPGAMAAPTPVSAYLHSATMVKAGVFLVGRLSPVFYDASLWVPVLTGLGALTMCYGALMAITKDDLKQIFAYTTVSQLGLLMCMYGLMGVSYEDYYTKAMVPAIDLDITQIANHAFYKAPLFIVAGAIGHLVGTRNLSELKGLFNKKDDHGSAFTNKAMVITILAAGYALAALPGSVSFQAKEMFLYGIYHAASANPIFWIIMILAIVTAICNVAIFVRLLTTLIGLPFSLEKAHEEHDDHLHGGHEHHEHEHGFWPHLIWIPGALIVSLQFIGGILPFLWNTVFLPLEVNAFYKTFAHGLPWFWSVSIFTPPLYCSLIAIAGGAALGVSPFLRKTIIDPHNHIFPATYCLLTHGSKLVYRYFQAGHLKYYTLFILGTLTLCFGYAALHDTPMLTLSQQKIPHILEAKPGVLLGLVLCTAAICIPIVTSRVIRVILLGVVGMTTLSMFLLYQAPDLALTQLMVEIIGVVLFVYVLRLLPDAKKIPHVGIWWKLPAAVITGLIFGWITLVAATTDPSALNPFDPKYANLGEWFAAYSYHGPESSPYGTRGGGGNNIVNVILVDFRGFDTMGEICVLGLAAMGVWSLIKGRGKRSSRKSAAQTNEPSQKNDGSNDVSTEAGAA